MLRGMEVTITLSPAVPPPPSALPGGLCGSRAGSWLPRGQLGVLHAGWVHAADGSPRAVGGCSLSRRPLGICHVWALRRRGGTVLPRTPSSGGAGRSAAAAPPPCGAGGGGSYLKCALGLGHPQRKRGVREGAWWQRAPSKSSLRPGSKQLVHLGWSSSLAPFAAPLPPPSSYPGPVTLLPPRGQGQEAGPCWWPGHFCDFHPRAGLTPLLNRDLGKFRAIEPPSFQISNVSPTAALPGLGESLSPGGRTLALARSQSLGGAWP